MHFLQRLPHRIRTLLRQYNIGNYQISLVVLCLVLSVFGAFMVDSAQHGLFASQMTGVVLGLIVMTVISFVSYAWVLKFTWVLYAINIILLLAVRFFGVEAGGAVRWLRIFGLQFQPSDLSKIIMILFFARYFMEREKKVNHPMTIGIAVALLLPSIYLIYQQPNLSNTLTLFFLFCFILFISGLSYKLIGIVLAVLLPLMTIFLLIVIQPNQTLLANYQRNRIMAWLNPQEFAQAEAAQQLNSVMAIGSGQLTGKGFNNDSIDSLKNSNFLSEPQNDFIFAIIGEELGFVGCSFVIILLLLIVIVCLLTGVRAKDLAGRIICGGVGALIGIQTFINVGVATNILPNTGISLPFVSAGLTSLVTFYISIGFVLNVGLHPHKLSKKYPERYKTARRSL